MSASRSAVRAAAYLPRAVDGLSPSTSAASTTLVLTGSAQTCQVEVIASAPHAAFTPYMSKKEKILMTLTATSSAHAETQSTFAISLRLPS